MGNTFAKETKRRSMKKTNRKNLQKNNKIPNSASGRHSLDIEKLTKNLHLDENEILEKGRNSIRESLIKTFRHKAATTKNNKKKEEDVNDISNIEYDYNKIFALLFRKENDPFDKSSDNLINLNIKKEKDLDLAIDNNNLRKNINLKNDRNDLNNGSKMNNINIVKFAEIENKEKEQNNKEKEQQCTCRKKNNFKRNDQNLKSFVTAISKENSEDYLIKNNNNDDEKINEISTENFNTDSMSPKDNYDNLFGRKALIEEEKYNEDFEKMKNNIPFEEKEKNEENKINNNNNSENNIKKSKRKNKIENK